MLTRRQFFMSTAAVMALLPFALKAPATTRIEIDEWSDRSESSFTFSAPGHHAERPFREALREHLTPQIGEDDARRDAEELEVRHIWVRPEDDDQFGTFYYPAKCNEAGAVPFTQTEWV